MEMKPVFTGTISVSSMEITPDMRAQLSVEECARLDAIGGKGIGVHVDCQINAAGLGQVMASLLKSLFDSLEKQAGPLPPEGSEVLRRTAFATAMQSMGAALDSMATVQGGRVQ